MSVSPSTYLGLKVPGDFSEEDLWGAHLNQNWERISEAIRGQATYTVETGVSEYTLPEQNYTGGSAHKPIIKINGGQDTDLDLILPTKPQVWVLINDTSDGGGGPYTVTPKTATGNGPEIAHGSIAVIACDGTDVRGVFVSSDFMTGSNNLSEITSPSAALASLGLTGALLAANNLSELSASAATARNNLGINSSLVLSLLPASGVVPGTYNGVTYDEKGRATAAANVTPNVQWFESPYATAGMNLTYTYTHGLAGSPNHSLIIWLKCISADAGFAVNEEVPLSPSADGTVVYLGGSSSATRVRSSPILWLPNSTQVKIRTPQTVWYIGQPTGGEMASITANKWQIKLFCSRVNIS